MARCRSAYGIDEQFVRPLAQLDIGRGDILDDVGHLRVGHRRTDQRAELGILVGLAAERDLIEFLAVLLDAENADMADMVMAAGIDAAGNIDVQPAKIARQVVVAEAARDLLRDRDRARVGEAAIIEARAGDDVGERARHSASRRRWRRARATAPAGRAGQRAAAPDSARGRRGFRRTNSGRPDRRSHPSARRWRRPACRLPA